MECYKCKYNGKGSSHCIECAMMDQSDDKRAKTDGRLVYGDWIESVIAQPDVDEDDEMDEGWDTWRRAIYDIFDLSQHQLLMLKSIVNGKTLSDHARDMEALTGQPYTRFRAFQCRVQILRKLPWLRFALLTDGQRKPLNTEKYNQKQKNVTR